MLDLEQILSELEKKTDLSRKELEERIKKKHEELSGLVSLEGAGHLVARDLGINLLTVKKRSLKIKDLTDKMRNVSIKGRIVFISETREFERKDKTKGRVCNLMITDGTGEIRVPLWDKQVDMIEEGKLQQGDVVELKNVDVRESAFSGLEIRLPRFSRIEKIEDDGTIPKEPVRILSNRIEIKDAKEGFYEVKGNIVHIFNTNPIFRVCPECRGKLEETEKGYKCEEHGIVEPEVNMVISGIIDDGTGSLRAVFFREQAQAISNVDPSVLLSMGQDEAINLIKENVLGNEVVLRGRIQRNKVFDTLELVVNDVKELNIQEESKRLINEINFMSKG